MMEYEAKFAREAKDKPSDWIIAPIKGRPGLFELVYVGE